MLRKQPIVTEEVAKTGYSLSIERRERNRIREMTKDSGKEEGAADWETVSLRVAMRAEPELDDEQSTTSTAACTAVALAGSHRRGLRPCWQRVRSVVSAAGECFSLSSRSAGKLAPTRAEIPHAATSRRYGCFVHGAVRAAHHPFLARCGAATAGRRTRPAAGWKSSVLRAAHGPMTAGRQNVPRKNVSFRRTWRVGGGAPKPRKNLRSR